MHRLRMRILDVTTDKSIKKIILYLTNFEALEFRDSLNDLIKKPLNNHAHISSEDYQKEVTICIYGESNLNGFDKRSIELIKSPLRHLAKLVLTVSEIA